MRSHFGFTDCSSGYNVHGLHNVKTGAILALRKKKYEKMTFPKTDQNRSETQGNTTLSTGR